MYRIPLATMPVSADRHPVSIPHDEHCRATFLRPGGRAPDFTLPSGASGETVSLSDFRGRPVVLVFYPADWSPVCGDQLALYNELLDMLDEYGAKILAISVDSAWSHAAYGQERKLAFPLLSDFEPKGAVATQYGVLRRDGFAERAIFVIDAEGIIRWSEISPFHLNPGADGIFRALDELQTSPADATRANGGH